MIDSLCEEAGRRLVAKGFQRVDYIAVRDASALAKITALAPKVKLRVLGAAVLGTTRLIDNVAVP